MTDTTKAPAGDVEPVSEQRLKYETLIARLSVQKASEHEAIAAIKQLCRDNERLAVACGKQRARAEAAEAHTAAAVAAAFERAEHIDFPDDWRDTRDIREQKQFGEGFRACRAAIRALIPRPAQDELDRYVAGKVAEAIGQCDCGGGVDLPGGSMFVRPCPVHALKGNDK